MAATDYYNGEYQNTSKIDPFTGIDYSGIDASGQGYWPNGNSGTYYAPGGLEATNRIADSYDNMLDPSLFSQYAPAEDAGNLDMIRATGQSVLANKYFQTPGYQLLFGSGRQQMDPRLSPTQRYKQSPGYQYAVNEALRGVNRGSAARGLLESGRTQRDLLSTAKGLADQDYGNWWNQLSGNYENYQNRLANLASAGMGQTGSQNILGVGQQNAQGSLATGQQVGGLLANQGQFGAGGMLSTGQAQGQNVMQAADINARTAQANAQNQTSMAGSAMGLLGGIF